MLGLCLVMQFLVSFSSFATILLRKRELIAFPYLCYCNCVAVCSNLDQDT